MKIIKFVVITVFAFFIFQILTAEDEPQYIPKMSYDIKTADWYNHQAELWLNKLNQNTKNEFAWLNYYKALRYAAILNTKTLAERTLYFDKMNALIDAMAKEIPDSYVYHYCKWIQGGNNPEYFSDLQKAFDKRQDYSELASDFVAYYEITFNKERRDYFLQKWYDTRSLSPNLLYYSYNVLQSLDSNAIIVTSGDNDTYPLWMLQAKKDLRTDVLVLNTSLLASKAYRDTLIKINKIKCNSSLMSDDSLKSKSYNEACAGFIKSIADSSVDRPIYLSLPAGNIFRKELNGKLYVIGLAYRVSNSMINSIKILESNWKKFVLGYFEFNPYSENYGFNESWLPDLDLNYATPAFALYEHYIKTKDKAEAEKIKDFLLQIGKNGGMEKVIEDILTKMDSKQ